MSRPTGSWAPTGSGTGTGGEISRQTSPSTPGGGKDLPRESAPRSGAVTSRTQADAKVEHYVVAKNRDHAHNVAATLHDDAMVSINCNFFDMTEAAAYAEKNQSYAFLSESRVKDDRREVSVSDINLRTFLARKAVDILIGPQKWAW
eukprot:TRINITY_DN78766_c0_g1_i1.p1 TRINITY_DN78766_c0_g1~~TRINITY_DN78766_c0_g1_i1.p1  ORF type:complete len:147 (+),score=16.08 TRINITY_DN78766_c0_g1_i1:54-494(+)